MTIISLNKYKNNKTLQTNDISTGNLQVPWSFILIICLGFVYISFMLLQTQKLDVHIFLLKKDNISTKSVSPKFLSFGLDSSLLKDMKNLPIYDNKLANLARHLSPAYVRIGGTHADCLYFNETDDSSTFSKMQNLNRDPIDDQDLSNFTLTSDDFLSLYKFTQVAKINMIFDLNVLIRNSDGSWNSDNAKKIVLFAKGHGMEVDWQLGNEPNSFHHVFNKSIPAEQLAKDYCTLRTLLNESGYQESILVGPEANHIGDENGSGVNYVKLFVDNVKNCVDFVTWHQYYLNGHSAQIQDFLNATVFNRLPSQIDSIQQALTLNDIPMWISETSSAYGGGAPKLSDRFVAGFLFLDKLGYSAKTGIQVVIRQTLFGGNYAMVGNDLNPNPDWWVAVIYKKFVSEKVLNLVGPDNFGNVRLYAHCALNNAQENEGSSIVIYGVNLNQEKTNIYIQNLPKKSKIFSYVLTSDKLGSRYIFMNGQILKLKSNGDLPHLKPKLIDTNQVISLEPYSMIFFLIRNVDIPACL